MLEFKDTSGKNILTVKDSGEVTIHDKAVATEIEKHIIKHKEKINEKTDGEK
jgi:hypothetical protein